MTLDKLNFTITDEDNESVKHNSSLIAKTSIVGKSTATAFNVDDSTDIVVNDTLYNGNNEIIGVVSDVPNGTSITISRNKCYMKW